MISRLVLITTYIRDQTSSGPLRGSPDDYLIFVVRPWMLQLALRLEAHVFPVFHLYTQLVIIQYFFYFLESGY